MILGSAVMASAQMIKTNATNFDSVSSPEASQLHAAIVLPGFHQIPAVKKADAIIKEKESVIPFAST